MRRTYDLLRTVLRPQRPRARGRRWGIFVLGSIVVASIAWSARRYELPVELPIQLPVQLPALDLAALLSPAAKHVHRPAVPSVDGLIERAERVGRLWREVEHYYELEIAPIERVLMLSRGPAGSPHRLLVMKARGRSRAAPSPSSCREPLARPDHTQPVAPSGSCRCRTT